MARIPYPDLTNLPDQAQAALDSMVAPLNLIRMCAHAPTLVAPLVKLSTAILTRLRMSARHREMLILRTAWLTDCEYELAQHQTIGRELGLTTEEIDAVCAESPDPIVLSVTDRELLHAVDQIIGDTDLAPDNLARLTQSLGYPEVVELFIVVGHYRMFSGLLKGLDVDVDPQGEKFAALSARYGAANREKETSR